MFSPCKEVQKWMTGFGRPWGIAGGWAIDLYIGKETRIHSDVEVAIHREDQRLLKEALPEWSFDKAVNHELIPWGSDWLELPIHEIHGTNEGKGAKLEVLLNETEKGKWIFRRDPGISFPQTEFFIQSPIGIPILNPAIVLLYKARNPREKDQADFLSVNKLLGEKEKCWLKEALLTHIPGHQWISEL